MKIIPSKEAVVEALKNPNGWVYEIIGDYENKENIPPQAIKGAWKVNDKGIIEGDYIPNPKFTEIKKP